MNKQEALEFFEKVKGKKIRWSEWGSELYIIPVSLVESALSFFIKGTLYHSSRRGSNYTFRLNRGFEKNAWDECWEYFSEEDLTSIQQNVENKHKCNCNSRDLFNFGCKCGGI